MNNKTPLTNAELLDALDILREMLDDEQHSNIVLRNRVHELEVQLATHNIEIPNYDLWHGILPMA